MVPRGGPALAKKTGIDVDKLKAAAFGGQRRRFCQKSGLSPELQLSLRKYGGTSCHSLCLFWTRRMQYFYDVWAVAGVDGCVFTHEALDGAPGREFAEPDLLLAAEGSVVEARFSILLALVPGPPR